MLSENDTIGESSSQRVKKRRKHRSTRSEDHSRHEIQVTLAEVVKMLHEQSTTLAQAVTMLHEQSTTLAEVVKMLFNLDNEVIMMSRSKDPVRVGFMIMPPKSLGSPTDADSNSEIGKDSTQVPAAEALPAAGQDHAHRAVPVINHQSDAGHTEVKVEVGPNEADVASERTVSGSTHEPESTELAHHGSHRTKRGTGLLHTKKRKRN